MTFETKYGCRVIRFDLERRSVKSLTIRVLPSGLVEVVCPNHATDDAIRKRVAGRGRWIVQQQAAFAAFFKKVTSPAIRNGESARYLGRQYRLRIRKGTTEGVKLTRSVLEITIPGNRATDRAGRLLERWFNERALQKITERFAHCAELVRPFRIPNSAFSLRRMQRRWGSCSAKGRVLINPVLVKTPVDCIDYVIVHELCHLRHHSHGPEFYHLLGQVLPDWKRRKARLERCAG